MEAGERRFDHLREHSIGLPQVLFQSITHMAPAAAVAYSIYISVPDAKQALPPQSFPLDDGSMVKVRVPSGHADDGGSVVELFGGKARRCITARRNRNGRRSPDARSLNFSNMEHVQDTAARGPGTNLHR